MLLVFGQPLDPLDLLRKHLDVMSVDWRNDKNHYSKVILSINEHLSSLDKCITDFINIQDLLMLVVMPMTTTII